MRLIRGTPGTGKTALVLREFSDKVRTDLQSNDLRIIVPTATLVRLYQHELARAGLVFDPNLVVSLSRFALDSAPHQKLAPAILIRALTRDALTRLQLPEFSQVATTSGMTDIILETITRFENANCTPERLQKFRNLTPHAKAFARIWKEVDTAITERGFATRGQIFRAAAQAISAKTAPPLTLWFDGFLRFSPLESDLIRALAATCDVTLTLTDGTQTLDARRLAMELGATDHLLPSVPRHNETIAVRAPSPEREADEIARRILELNAHGTEFPNIAVALRDVEGWLPLLRNTFDRFGIPARYYFSEPVRKHPVAVFLDGLISCALATDREWDFTATLAALRAHPVWGHSADFDRFDFRVREAMPGHGAQALLACCESEHLRTNIADCLRVGSWRGDRMRPTAWQQRFEQLASSLYRVRTIPEPTDYAAVETARSHAAALRAWSTALETAATFLPDASASLDQFHAAVSDALDGVTMQIPDHRQNVVHVMSAFEARQWQVGSLFICGMTARDYPRAAAQNLLFPDADIDRLRAAGIPLRTAADDDRDEETLFEALKTRASQNLILTVSTRDTGGKTVVPSRHFDEAEATAQSMVCALQPHVSPALPQAGHISAPSLSALAGQHLKVSLTALEDLAKCRFRFFAGRSLNLKGVPERPNERISFSALGLIVHEAMENWLSDRTRDFVALFEATFDEFSRKRNFPAGYKLEVERVLLRRVARKVNESVQWPHISSEMEVDCGFEFPGGVTVSCRVDRIDRLNDTDCIIIDYKSGKTTNVKKLVQRETSLQGPLYALAVREKLGLNTVAMVFLAVREDKIFGWGTIPGSELELIPTPQDWVENAKARTIARLESFLAGDVHVSPTNPDDCQWCDYASACRVETTTTEFIKIGVSGAN